MVNQALSIGHPRPDLGRFEGDEVYIVPFLAPLEEIVVNSRQIFGDLAGFYILLVEQAADAGMLG